MAPRVDRTVDSSFPARWSSPKPIRKDRSWSARIESETASDLERTPNPLDHPNRNSCHSSRVKVQSVRGDDRVVEPGTAATRGGRLAQLVRALP